MSTDTVVAAIRESAASQTPLRIAGRSTWLDAGRPVRATKELSLRDDAGVVSYVPGDLTITVRAGTPLREIARVTAEHDQWLPLDPFGTDEGSIGATIATASSGPLATGFGMARDLVLGLEFVTGRGDVVRSGGKVVKNVAGFDLSRLLTGSWGTLGVITEVTLRLYGRPRAERTFTIDLPAATTEMSARLKSIESLPLNPMALELVSGSAARALQLGRNPLCLVRLGGNEAAVTAQMAALSTLGRLSEVNGDIWTKFRQLETGATSVIRLSSLPARFQATAPHIVGDVPPGVLLMISLRRGVMRIVSLAGDESAEAPQSPMGISVDPPDAHSDAVVIFEKLPADVWPATAPSVVADALSRGIRTAYDPHNILNPGILGD